MLPVPDIGGPRRRRSQFNENPTVGGAHIGLCYWNEIDAGPWPLQLAFLTLVAFAVGYFVVRRGLAGRARRVRDRACALTSVATTGVHRRASVEGGGGLRRYKQGPRDKTIVVTLLGTGLRVGELAGLRLSDIDLGERVLRVRASTSKSVHPREIALPVEVVKKLDRYVRDHRSGPEGGDEPSSRAVGEAP